LRKYLLERDGRYAKQIVKSMIFPEAVKPDSKSCGGEISGADLNLIAPSSRYLEQLPQRVPIHSWKFFRCAK